jgi:hypothetical protein
MEQGEWLIGDTKNGKGQRSGAARPRAPEWPKQRYSYSNPNPFHQSLYCYGRFFYIVSCNQDLHKYWSSFQSYILFTFSLRGQ